MEFAKRGGNKMVSAKFSHPKLREKSSPVTETSCFSCGLAFVNRLHYEDHIRLFHDPKEGNLWRFCFDCGKMFPTEPALIEHYSDHDVAKILLALESHDWPSEHLLEASELQSTSVPVAFKRPHNNQHHYGRRSESQVAPVSLQMKYHSPGRPRKQRDPDYIPDAEDNKEWRKPRLHCTLAPSTAIVSPIVGVTPPSVLPDGVKTKNKRGRPRKHPLPAPKLEVVSTVELEGIQSAKNDAYLSEESGRESRQKKVATPVGWIRGESGVTPPPPSVFPVNRKRKISSPFPSHLASIQCDSPVERMSPSISRELVVLNENRHNISSLASLQRNNNGNISVCLVCAKTFTQPPQLVHHMTSAHQGNLHLIEKVVNFNDDRIPERKVVFDSNICEICSEMFPCKSSCLQHVMIFHEKELSRCPAGSKADIQFQVLLGQTPTSTGEINIVRMTLVGSSKRSTDG